MGHFVAGEKVGHCVRWDNLSLEKYKFNIGLVIHMPEIWPKIAQDISQICPRYAPALPEVWGFKLRKWDKMSPGRVHKLGHYVAGEVHNAVGHFFVGTICLLTLWTAWTTRRRRPWRSLTLGYTTLVEVFFYN